MSIVPPTEEQQPAHEHTPRPGSRYSDLDHTDLVHLLDEVDDERARARFREAIYISVIIWLLLFGLAWIAPHYIHPPFVLEARPENQKQITITELPPDMVKKAVKTPRTHNLAQRNQEAESPHPSPESPMPAPNPPAAQQPAPQPTQQPQQAAPQQTAPKPQQAQQQPTPPQPKPQQQPQLADSPRPQPSATKPNFNMNQSAGQQIAQAAHGGGPTAGRAGGDYGAGPTRNGGGRMGTQILSDTQGVDFSRYLARLLRDIKRNWDPLIPEECKPPILKQGITGVRFTINKDGSIAAMHLDYSTHDDAINRSAWGSITSMGQAEPLPPEFKGPNLELRIEFRVNKDGPDAR